MTCTTETRAGASKTKCLLKTSETRIPRRITRNTLLAELRRENMRRSYKVKDIIEWDEYINRLGDNRLMKTARNKLRHRQEKHRPTKEEMMR
jgi:hypothetical protein